MRRLRSCTVPYALCVDDPRDVLVALRKDLAVFEEAFEIIDCESAAEASEVMDEIDASGRYVAFLICDHVVPERNGVDFLTEVHHDSGWFIPASCF